MPKRLAGLAGGLRPGSRRTRVTAACAAIVVVALAVGIIVGTGPESSQGASTPGKVAGATTVQRRDLVSTDTESGTLSYANPQTVFNRVSGTITWLPQVGQLIKSGQALYYVDNAPIVLFNGTTPAYRDLSSSDSNGPDILELNRDLKNMGFDSSNEITVNDTWQTGTTNAVEAWQNSLGQTETGTISLGQIVFLPGTQRITSIDTVLGSTGGAGASSASAGAGSGSSGSGTGTTSGASYTTSAGAHTEFVGLTTTKVEPLASTAAVSEAKAAVIRTDWLQACTAHDMAKVKKLKREHPRLLAGLPAAACKPHRDVKPQPSSPATGTTTATTAPATSSATTPPTATNTAPSAPVAPPTPTVTVPSVLTPTWGPDVASAAARPGSGSPSTGSTGAGSGQSGAGTGQSGAGTFGGSSSTSKEDATINRALKALLKAETLLLQRSAASSKGGAGTSGASRGGATGASASSLGTGSSGAGRLSAGSASAGSGASAGGSASSGSGGSGSSGSGSSGSGSSGGTAQAILATTSNQLVVTVDLDASKQSEAVVGEPVTVEMPDGSVVNGKVTAVSPVAQSSSSGNGNSGSGGNSGGGSGGSGNGSSGSSGATIPVTVTLHGRIPSSGLDQAAVSVNFQQQVANNVLSVPVTALLATQGGGYAVQEAAAPHKLIPVTPGLFAAGYVQVSSSEIFPGLQVTDSQG